MHMIIYSVSPEEETIPGLNTKVKVKNVLSVYFPVSSLCCDRMKRIVCGLVRNRRGNWISVDCGESLDYIKF